MEHNIEKIVESVLIENGIGNYNKKDLELQLQIHPNYPSFQSITDALDYFDIDNIAIKVPRDALDQLPKSFISLVKNGNSDEIVAVNKKSKTIEIKHSSLKKKKYSFEDFKQIWVTNVIAVEDNSSNNFISGQSLFQNILIAILLISVGLIFVNRNWSIGEVFFLGLSIAGLTFSVFAIQERLGYKSQTVHQFCTSVGKSNCGDVINNNSGILFKGFSLADAGVLFFGSLTLYQIFHGYTSALLIPVLIGVPFVLYSLYSQAFIIKTWCAICLSMGLVSIGLAVIALTSLSININWQTLPGLALVTSLFTIGYFFIRDKIKENKEYRSQNLKLNRFKRDGQIFGLLYNNSDKVADTTILENEIILGNPNANFKIISLTNPMCGFCKNAFEAYSRLLKSMGEHLQIVVRLSINPEETNNQATKIGLRLFEIYDTQGSQAFIEAYTSWFADRTFSKWIKKFGTPNNNMKHNEIFKKQINWANKHELHYTPASIINGTIYPKKYTYDEFFYFVSMLIEQQKSQTVNEDKTVEV
ncbi:vitamin K epoxide reductase family protein [Aquimarina spongiae]|uniref:Protein-disulfide isomerase n=1 Tax=Aquimarina spongiae TaxID=570521 RepID=A0A1M6EFW4_9FLAO|nr:vitamin K epoxide reductase family protein [Aquimarina spongiae]SHI84313.1 Protein-disulfide isomerase [Aquimarina spongiae]